MHAFAGDFGRGVKRGLDGKRRVFRRGNYFRLAINAAGGTERDAPDAVGAHGFEDVVSGDGVLLKILAGMVEAEADVGIGGEMEHGVTAGHRPGQRGQIQVVALDEFEVRAASARLREIVSGRWRNCPSRRPFCRRAARRSTRLLPMKPAAPVTKTFSMIGREA